jgi:hypothetical protein
MTLIMFDIIAGNSCHIRKMKLGMDPPGYNTRIYHMPSQHQQHDTSKHSCLCVVYSGDKVDINYRLPINVIYGYGLVNELICYKV